ncbi:MAG: hypothetical protein QNJ12_00355 [Ilumatobacter sp.]|uniref:hypothetical protein n=1 Tax=Ilumatobacter sp. TaxID=1967498 RepID=UPI00261AB356|nr:hypothetical protein [Ilumatobacter sp.]MDJ0767202.1 hypothetical protein [Ilumatobacter sp.]
MAFDTPIIPHDDAVTTSGPLRRPRQMLADQEYDGHASVHDGAVADDLGLTGAPIEGPTHFSQFDPLAFSAWGQRWFETGCISAHFRTMVVEGEEVVASVTSSGEGTARIEAAKADGTPVLTGTATVDPAAPTELGERLAAAKNRDAGELFIVDQLSVGDRASARAAVSIDMTTANGNLYPFSLRQKLDAITEPSPWYETDDNPWGRPIVPFEMISVLSGKAGGGFRVRGPAVGLFVDLEVRLVAGPLFVGDAYLVKREVVAVGQSRRVESYWIRNTISSATTGAHAATVLLHSGVFKASYAGYPADRL